MSKGKFLNQLLCPLSNVNKIRRQLVARVMLLNNLKFVKHSSTSRIFNSLSSLLVTKQCN